MSDTFLGGIGIALTRVGMNKGILIVLIAGLIMISPRAKANPVSHLSQQATNVLEEYVGLRQEVMALQRSVDEMGKNLQDSKDKLKKISIASTTARRCLRLIKKVEPEWVAQSELLKTKLSLLQEKRDSLQMVATELSWQEDSVRGSLLQEVSEFVANRDQTDPIN